MATKTTLEVPRATLQMALGVIGKCFSNMQLSHAVVTFEQNYIHLTDPSISVVVDIEKDITPVLETLDVTSCGIKYNNLSSWLRNLYKIDNIKISSTPGKNNLLFQGGNRQTGRRSTRQNITKSPSNITLPHKVDDVEWIVTNLEPDDLNVLLRPYVLSLGDIVNPVLKNIYFHMTENENMVVYSATGYVSGRSVLHNITSNITDDMLMFGESAKSIMSIPWGDSIRIGKKDNKIIFTDDVITITSPLAVGDVPYPAVRIDELFADPGISTIEVPREWLRSELESVYTMARNENTAIPCNLWTFLDKDTQKINVVVNTQANGVLQVSDDWQHEGIIEIGEKLLPAFNFVPSFAPINPKFTIDLIKFLEKQVDSPFVKIIFHDAILTIETLDGAHVVGTALLNSEARLSDDNDE